MQTLEREVTSVAQGVWSMILGLELRPDASTTHPDGAAVVGAVTISGAWEGRVTLRCPSGLAARATSILFGVDPAAATPDLARDVVGELTNVLGGNIKALLPEPSRLSLPTVVDAPAGEAPPDPPGGVVVADVVLACGEDPLRVRVVARAGTTP